MDDFLILARDSSDKDSFKAAIGAAFKMKDLGTVARFLGMDVQLLGYIYKPISTFTPCGLTFCIRLWVSSLSVSLSALPLRRVAGLIPVDCLIKCQLSFQAICLHKSLFPRLISLFSRDDP